MGDIDEDVKPVVDELDACLDRLDRAVTTLFDPAVYNEDTLAEKLSLDEQAYFATVSAFALANCLYGLKRLDGRPVDAQLVEKIVRVKEYAGKAKQTREVTGGAAASPASAETRRKGAKASRDDIAAGASIAIAERAAIIEAEDAAADDQQEPRSKAHRPQVNKDALKRLMQ
jgi:hypothetical protein